MYDENPGLDLYRHDVYIIQTEDSARWMADAISKMVKLGCRFVTGEKIGRPTDEGYFPRGTLVNEISERNGAERVVNMLMKKLRDQPFESEVSQPKYDRIIPAPRLKNLKEATIALVTDGGLVPKGNPDKIEISRATRFGKYDIAGIIALDPLDYEVNHEGYDSGLVRQDPNRLVPVDVMRDLEREGLIGRLHNRFYSTTGVANIVETVRKMGIAIARDLKEQGVSAVILTST
jgi:glycine reductase